MKRYEILETLFCSVDSSFAGKVLNEPFHTKVPCRPPKNSLGVFKVHLLKRLRHIPSDIMLLRQM